MVYFVIALVVAYTVWAELRSGRRIETGLCARCGRAPAEESPPGVPRTQRMCRRCVDITNRNHARAVQFFFLLAIVGGVASVFGTATDIRRGVDFSMEYVWIFLASTLPSVTIALAIRYWTRRKSSAVSKA